MAREAAERRGSGRIPIGYRGPRGQSPPKQHSESPITGEKSKFALAMCEKVDDPTVQRLDEDGQIITVEASATAAPASAVAMHNNV